jgi:hypothetical protein
MGGENMGGLIGGAKSAVAGSKQVISFNKEVDEQLEPVVVGMRLEARDRANPHMVCVATVAKVGPPTYCPTVTIHFDGWTDRCAAAFPTFFQYCIS